MNLKNRSNATSKQVDSKQVDSETVRATRAKTDNHDIQIKRGIGVFADYRTTDKALRELKNIGYGMDDVSIIGRDSEHLNQSGQTGETQVQDLQTEDGDHAGDGVKTGLVSGGAVGGLAGLLVGLGTLAIPGVGPIMLAGAAATTIASTAAGGAMGAAAGGLVGGLVGLGIPEDRAKVYNEHLSEGKYLVIIDGTDSDIDRVEPIVKRHDIKEWNVYEMSDQSTKTRNSPTPPQNPDQQAVDQGHDIEEWTAYEISDQSTKTRNSPTPPRNPDQRAIDQRAVDQTALNQRTLDQRTLDQRGDRLDSDQRGAARFSSGPL